MSARTDGSDPAVQSKESVKRFITKGNLRFAGVDFECCWWLVLPAQMARENIFMNTKTPANMTYLGLRIIGVTKSGDWIKAFDSGLPLLSTKLESAIDLSYDIGNHDLPAAVSLNFPNNKIWDTILRFGIGVPMTMASHVCIANGTEGEVIGEFTHATKHSIPFLTAETSTPYESNSGFDPSARSGLNMNQNADPRSTASKNGAPCILITHDYSLLQEIQHELNTRTRETVSGLVQRLVDDRYFYSGYMLNTAFALDLSLLRPAAPCRPVTSPGLKSHGYPAFSGGGAPTTANVENPLDIGMLCAILQHWNLNIDFAHRELSLRCPESLKSIQDFIPVNLSSLKIFAELYSQKRDRFVIRSDYGGQTSDQSIKRPYDIYPRRLWDLQTNRVIPAYLVEFHLEGRTLTANEFPQFIAISHSWRPGPDLQLLETPINQFAWPVPIPKNFNLRRLRSDLRQRFPSIRYCWLDVLCLRQIETRLRPNLNETIHSASQPLLEVLGLDRDYTDIVREQEHRVDVPTLGNIYDKAKSIYRFFNGLGQEVAASGWDDRRHWMSRAWTLQENVPDKMVDGGLPNQGPNFYNMVVTRRGVTKRVREFIDELSYTVSGTNLSVLALAAEMGKRHATNDLDKIAGLSYLLRFPELPTYSANAHVPIAWHRCVSNMNLNQLAELFWNCPLGGSSSQYIEGTWVPSWNALQSCPTSFVPYGPSSRQVPNPQLEWTDVFVLGVSSIERLVEGEYLIDLVLGGWGTRVFVGSPSNPCSFTHVEKTVCEVISKRFFISHNHLELDISSIELHLHKAPSHDEPEGISVRLMLSHSHNILRSLRRTCILVSLDLTEKCSTWVLLQRRRNAYSENMGTINSNWHKIAVLRTDEDMLNGGAARMSRLRRFALVGGSIQVWD